MPRFHFNIHDGVSLPDRRGTDLPGLHEAQVEALRLAGDLLRDGATRRRLGQDWRMEVTDEVGTPLFRLDLTVADAARLR